MVRLWSSFVQRKNSESDKPLEDVCSSRLDSGAFCVADGITRCRDAFGRYPNPSLGKLAAEVAVQQIMDTVCSSSRAESGIDMLLPEAFNNANKAIGIHASEMSSCDFYFNDLPGTTATCAIVREMGVTFGHIGDSMLVRISKDGTIIRLTHNQTANAERWFQTQRYLSASARILISRHHFRNNPGQEFGYGALTGEPAALDMVEYGFCETSAGDRLLLFSDGLNLWFDRVLADLNFATMVRNWLDAGELETIVDSAEREERRWRGKMDDKTLLVVAIE